MLYSINTHLDPLDDNRLLLRDHKIWLYLQLSSLVMTVGQHRPVHDPASFHTPISFSFAWQQQLHLLALVVDVLRMRFNHPISFPRITYSTKKLINTDKIWIISHILTLDGTLKSSRTSRPASMFLIDTLMEPPTLQQLCELYGWSFIALTLLMTDSRGTRWVKAPV